jgi:formate hydrogenlyase subunit 3/multisubunit Na+/H+ antiporter MnhD subunit
MTMESAGGWLLGAAVLVPLVLGAAGFVTRAPWSGRALAWGALPAAAAACWPSPARLDAPWLLLGATLELDVVARTMLVLAALLWALAGIYARGYLADDPRRHGFHGFFLLCMAGNLGLILAADIVSFYTAFALMTFTAYGLVVHTRTPEAMRAGRVYLAMAVAGEAMLVAGLVLAASEAPSLELRAVSDGIARAPWRDVILALLLAGFGIKAGALPLHVWLPLAHPVAPTPASAVLSGCMIKAGLLGWIRILPVGDVSLPGWGGLVIALGVVSAVGGVALGLTQRLPKTLLAYSSISQMGIINIAFGVALAVPEAWPAALPAILLYAVHHGLAKGALFLGVGIVDRTARGSAARRAAVAGMAFGGLALAGAPLTSGSLVKGYLKDVAALGPGAWPLWLDVLLPLTSVATATLMAVLIVRLVRRAGHAVPGQPRTGDPMLLSWLGSLIAVAAIMWILPRVLPLGVAPKELPGIALLWDATWPVIVGIALVTFGLSASRTRRGWRLPHVPPGDVLAVVEKGGVVLRRVQRLSRHVPLAQPVLAMAEQWYSLNLQSGPEDKIVRAETVLTRWEVGAAMLVLVAALLAMTVARG